MCQVDVFSACASNAAHFILQGGKENLVSSCNYKEILGHRCWLVFSANLGSNCRRVYGEKNFYADVVNKLNHATTACFLKSLLGYPIWNVEKFAHINEFNFDLLSV